MGNETLATDMSDGPQVSEAQIDAAISAFGTEMKKKLMANRFKGSWTGLNPFYLLRRLRGETQELEDALMREEPSNADIIQEAADVANFAMFIATNAGCGKTATQTEAEVERKSWRKPWW